MRMRICLHTYCPTQISYFVTLHTCQESTEHSYSFRLKRAVENSPCLLCALLFISYTFSDKHVFIKINQTCLHRCVSITFERPLQQTISARWVLVFCVPIQTQRSTIYLFSLFMLSIAYNELVLKYKLQFFGKHNKSYDFFIVESLNSNS